MAALLVPIAISSLVCFILIGGVAFYALLEEKTMTETELEKCFPSLEGSVRIANEGFSFLTCDQEKNCLHGDDEDSCGCFLTFSLDGKEQFSHKVTNLSGVPDQFIDLSYGRWRHEPLRTLHVTFDNQTLTFDLIFNLDLTSIFFLCENYQLPSASCPRIIVQKTKEHYRKLRSCGKNGLIWDIDDVSFETPQ